MSLFDKGKGESVTLTVEGMSCMHCVGKVEKGLLGMDGVYSAKVNLDQKEAVVRFDPKKLSSTDIKKKIIEVGYQVP